MRIIPFIMFGMLCTNAFGATDWWNQETICAIDDTMCYAKSTLGIDASLESGWDVSGGCRGMKYICPDALTSGGDVARTMERSAIASGSGIIRDFDTDVYVASENCYGARKSKNGGTMVSAGGNYVRVWCNGILSNPTSELPNGEITTGAQPTCAMLAADGIAAVLNGKCYGKQYNPNNYAIDCDGESPILVLLNGANYDPNGRGMAQSEANSIFGSMFSTSERQRGVYFNR